MILPKKLILDWNNFDKTIDILYNFYRDNIFNKMFINNKPIRCNIKALYNEKDYSFWHLITKSKEIQDNNIDKRDITISRCECLSWIPYILNNYNLIDNLLYWEAYDETHRQNRLYFWLKEEEYAIVLSSMKKYYILVTAYKVNQPYMITKLEKSYKRKAIISELNKNNNFDSFCNFDDSDDNFSF